MRELNELELKQVAGGWSFSKGTAAGANGFASADAGFAVSKTWTSSTNIHSYSHSEASNKSFALGYGVNVGSEADSSAGVSISY